MTTASRGDVVAIACAEVFRGDGAILASPMAPMPALGAKLARAVFEPKLLMTDGVASLLNVHGQVEGQMRYSRVFDVVWGGRRHVMMGASQIDREGNQNISCIGPHDKPKVQLLGVRGAPGNTIHHTTSYYVGKHSTRVFVDAVDMVSGVGPCRGGLELRAIVTNLCVLDFTGPDQGASLQSLHPWATLEEVQAATGFPIYVPPSIAVSRGPTELERRWLDHLDPERRVRATVEG